MPPESNPKHAGQASTPSKRAEAREVKIRLQY